MKITLAQHIEKMKKVVEEISKADKPVFLASGSAIAKFSERVFLNGQGANGGKFSYNNDTPLYVNPKTSPGKGFEPQGKPSGKTRLKKTARFVNKIGNEIEITRTRIDLNDGKKVFNNGQPHKTKWFPSYQAYRKVIGREASFVNWVLSGDLKSEIENRSLKKISDANYKMSVQSEENSGKLEGLIDKYPGVFEFSESEKQVYYKTFDKEFLKLLKEKLR